MEAPIIHLENVPLNTSDIPRSELDISNQKRSNPLPWKGQFSPQLVEVLLRTYASAEAMVLDPFVGSGTVLGECISLGLAASGVEVNPAAAILARMYTWANCSRANRAAAYESAASLIHQVLSSNDPTPLCTEPPAALRPQDVVAMASKAQPVVRSLIEAALVVADPSWSSVNSSRLIDALRRIRGLLAGMPEAKQPIRVIEGDARRIPLTTATADLVITSPPYINVFNYHQQYRPAVEALGHDVLAAARSEIGSNRKHRMNRFLTVIQYAMDMAEVLHELTRVTRGSARMIFVVGRESRVRGLRVLNGDLLCAVATKAAGLRVSMRQERSFTNRFGERIVEDILHFANTGRTAILQDGSASDIGVEFLERLLPDATGQVYTDIAAAIQAAESVKASPLYETISS